MRASAGVRCWASRIYGVECASAQCRFPDRRKILATNMKTQTHKSFFLLLTIAVIASMLLGLAGGARIIGWASNSIGDFGNAFATVHSAASAKPVAEQLEVDLRQPSNNLSGKRRCLECGVIVSM